MCRSLKYCPVTELPVKSANEFSDQGKLVGKWNEFKFAKMHTWFASRYDEFYGLKDLVTTGRAKKTGS